MSIQDTSGCAINFELQGKHFNSVSFDITCENIARWITMNTPELGSQTLEALGEIQRRLVRLRPIADKLLSINETLSATELMTHEFDPLTETTSVYFGKNLISTFKWVRAHPDVPVKPPGSLRIGAYPAGVHFDDESDQAREMKIELEDCIESFYYGAHRIVKLIQGLPGRKNFKVKSILVVRNKLIEHADHSTRYSFGFGTGGPIVRPYGSTNRQWVDAGFQTNVREMLAAIDSAFRTEHR
jgi:hypothetical protein